ncbi:hypothetical protein IT415_03590 [bacterium]|nr:hypothetical protein [bacterium]
MNQHATTGQNPIKPREIDKSKYSLAFTSPRWAWDQAGWLFAGGTALVAVSLVGRIINSIAQLMYRRDHNKPMSASLPTLHRKD